MVDAVGSVAKIVGVALKIKEAANTVHQNKKDCHHIKSRVDILNRTLSHHENNTELAEDSAVMAALEALDGILAEALEVITQCQEPRNIVCVYYTAGNLSLQLSKVEQRISSLSSDAMLTIISYQLLKKFQEGAPHPPQQIYAPSTGMASQRTNLTQKMAKQTQDEANKNGRTQKSQIPKFGDWDVHQEIGYTVQFDKVRGPKPNYEPVKVPKFGVWDDADHTHQAGSSGVTFERLMRHRSDYEPAVTYGAAGPAGDMVGEPRSLVHRIAEVAHNIEEAAETALQNRGDCVEIGRRVSKVSTLLPQLEDTKMADEPAMRRALEKLLVTFRRAHTLVTACQRRGIGGILWLSTPPGRLSRQLHEVQIQIASNIDDMAAIVLP